MLVFSLHNGFSNSQHSQINNHALGISKYLATATVRVTLVKVKAMGITITMSSTDFAVQLRFYVCDIITKI